MTQEEFIRRVTDGSAEEVAARLAEDPGLAESRTETGVSAFMTALYHRRSEVVEVLKDSGLELDVFESAAMGETAMVEAHVRAESKRLDEMSADGFTPLHFASFFGHLDTARRLLDLGAAPSIVAENSTRVQPLHSAAACKSLEVVTLLLERDAEVNARHEGGWTALHAAAMQGDANMVRVLIKHGAAAELTLDDGSTAQELAEKGGHSDVSEFLRPSSTE